jgi:hypothetical protein
MEDAVVTRSRRLLDATVDERRQSRQAVLSAGQPGLTERLEPFSAIRGDAIVGRGETRQTLDELVIGDQRICETDTPGKDLVDRIAEG